ncbi:unnamed protein product, partial [Anisakis simplex]|uniref:protein kinase C n=1 Tax=Anisakis simplex TaxID=6269 RepID=A0A0M3K322_ANISI
MFTRESFGVILYEADESTAKMNLTFQIQSGIIKDTISVNGPEISLKDLRQEAIHFIKKSYPDRKWDDSLADHILLYRHDHRSINILQLISSSSDVKDGTLVEVVISSYPQCDRLVVHPHNLYVHSYKSPTFCDFCGELLFGLVKQGLKCQGCGLNYHKRCASKIPNNCNGSRQRRPSAIPLSPLSPRNSLGTLKMHHHLSFDSYKSMVHQLTTPDILVTTSEQTDNDESSDGNFLQMPRKDHRSCSWSGRPLWMEVAEATKIKVPHTFQVHSYKRPTVCGVCKKLLKGIIRQGLQCIDCKFNCHKKCIERATRDCPGSSIIPLNFFLEADENNSNFGGSMENLRMISNQTDTESEDVDGSERISRTSNASTSDYRKRAQTTPSAPSRKTKNGDASYGNEQQYPVENIPLMRVVMSKKQTKRHDKKTLKEGWMMHYTNENNMRKKHYWRLDSKSIVMYQDEVTTRYYKELPLNEILEVHQIDCHQPLKQKLTHHFEIESHKCTYFIARAQETDNHSCGIVETSSLDDDSSSWVNAIRQALMPVTNQSSSSMDMSLLKAPILGETGQLGVQIQSEREFSQLYQIFVDEVLGSGQFGTVYGGIQRKSGKHVAVKLIDKMKFPSSKEVALKTEVEILRSVHHPGVVGFEQMLETPDRIFVVMEKLKGDMLEMILSSEKGRLSERITEFLVYQILVALRYLHGSNIVHCDLKPENILLASESDFPQVKLCDFGFARIIGARSFRRSVVGTPAYLAPEVLRNKGFNRSLDMWSVGVIVYVSLSGTFPFNEDEDINDQIQNAEFMYPPNPWKEITSNAIDFINGLLQVRMNKRLTVLKAL